MRSHPWLMPVLAALTLPMTIAASAHGNAEAANAASSTAAGARPAHHRDPELAASRPTRPHTAVKPAADRQAVVGRSVVRRPAPRPASPATARTRPAVEHRVAPPRIVSHTPGPTSWDALNAAITRIPSYHAGAARWVISSRYGHWGTADWYRDTIYVSPGVPSARLYDVAVHEWSHELSVLDYSGDVDAAKAAMNAYFGGSGLTGAERAADCMALVQGARWTHYTSCDNSHWRAGAARLVAGGRL